MNYPYKDFIKMYRQVRIGELIYYGEQMWLYTDIHINHEDDKIVGTEGEFKWSYLTLKCNTRIDKEFKDLGRRIYVNKVI